MAPTHALFTSTSTFSYFFSAVSPPLISVPPPRVLKLHYKETNVTVDCSVYGKPVPSVIWKKDGNAVELVGHFSPLKHGQKVVHNQFNTSSASQWNITSRLSLRTSGATYSEAGNYTCEASNDDSRSSVTETVELLCESFSNRDHSQ